jgi:hypothetical protein
MAAETHLKPATPRTGVVIIVPQPDGTRQTVTFFTDADRVVTLAVGAEFLLPLLTAPAKPPSIPQTLNAGNVPLAGITKTKGAEGKMLLTADETTKRNIGFMVPSIPCWFEGCEELRTQYEADVVAETADWIRRNPGKDCPGCVVGRINQKYLAILAGMDTSQR